MKKALTLSMAGHALLFAPLLLTRAPRESAAPPIEVALSPSEGGEGEGDSGAKSSRSTRKAPTLRSLLDLGLSPLPAATAKGHGHVKGNGDLDSLAVARNWTLEQETRSASWLQAVWDNADRHIEYPDDFVEQNIEGTVSLQVQLDEQGRRVGGFRRIRSSDRFLRAYVLAALTRAFAQPLPRRCWAKAGMAPALHLEFRTSPHTVAIRKVRGEIRRNQLRFARLAYSLPNFQRAVEKFRRKFIPPIIPFAGGFMIDFVHLYQMVDAWTSADPDDLRAERIEMMQKLFEKQAESAL